MNRVNAANINVKNEMALKAILMVLVILSHLDVGNEIIVRTIPLNGYVYLVVACFFFMSGFGCNEKYMQGKKFLLMKNCLKLLIPYYFFTVIWNVFFVIEPISSVTEVFCVILLKKFLPYSWYVVTQLICYFIWWCGLKIKEEMEFQSDIFIHSFVFSGLLLYTINRRIMGITPTTYITVFSFLGGILYSKCLKEHTAFIEKYYITFQTGATICALGMLMWPRNDSVISVVWANLESILFAVVIINLLMIVDIRNRLLVYFGRISYFSYLSQGIVQCIFSETYFCDVKRYTIDSKAELSLIVVGGGDAAC